MASDRETAFRDVGAVVQSVVLDALRRRAEGESLPDDEVIGSHPDLADLLRVELAKLRQICAAGNGTENPVHGVAPTMDMRACGTPGMFPVRCPHCREFFEASRDTPVTEIVCSVCGGHFNIADSKANTRAAPNIESLAHFDLIDVLGVGGFGTVWKARDHKLDRTVAVKIPHRGTLNNEHLEKFLREARAAAQLQHPSIVRVYEVGRDGESAYIVSDFVHGIPLNDWLTGQQPTMRQSAEICAQIADALQHAHDRGVIHRDLKPANILIDGEGQPHLMDFGLARREVGEITVTLDGQLLGTPAYMSPEQARGEAHTADGRSDIYSLGVILFELLTGELPFRGNPRMLMHQVIHDEPPSPRKFNSNIPRDLETITIKCLEKEPTRRYQTARDLSDEFNRYLAGEPIRARPISRAARAWRWARRRPAAAAFLVLLVIFAAASAAAFVRERAWSREVLAQKNEAESERASAEAVVSFLTNDVLAKASPNVIQDKAVRDTLVTALIEPAAATVGERFQNKPLIEAAVRRMLAQTLDELGRSDLALPHALAGLEQRRQALGKDHRDTVASLDSYAVVLQSLGRFQEAEPLAKRALEQRRKLLGECHPDTIMSVNHYALVLRWLDRGREAEPLLKGTLEQCRKVLGEDHPVMIESLDTYGQVLGSLNRWQEAEPPYKQALELRRKMLGEDHPDTVYSLIHYALVVRHLGRGQEAEPLSKRALEQCRKVLGEDHPVTIMSLTGCAIVLESLGRAEEAEPFYRRALVKARKVLGDEHEHTIIAMFGLGNVYRALGRLDEAETLYRQAIENARKVLGDEHQYTVIPMSGLASVYLALGRPNEAARMNAEVLKLGFVTWGLSNAKSNPEMLNQVIETAVRCRIEQAREPIDALILGELCLVAGNLERAELAIRAAIQKGGTEHYYDKSLGWCLRAQGREEESRDAFHDALKSCRRDDGSYNLENADVDHMTAAYFLDLVSEEEYVERVIANKKIGSFPWFYVGQRSEIEGNRAAAIAAYQRCVEPGTAGNANTVYALAHWRLRKLSERNDGQE